MLRIRCRGMYLLNRCIAIGLCVTILWKLKTEKVRSILHLNKALELVVPPDIRRITTAMKRYQSSILRWWLSKVKQTTYTIHVYQLNSAGVQFSSTHKYTSCTRFRHFKFESELLTRQIRRAGSRALKMLLLSTLAVIFCSFLYLN